VPANFKNARVIVKFWRYLLQLQVGFLLVAQLNPALGGIQVVLVVWFKWWDHGEGAFE
jgi:hypothetical protein